MKKLLVGKNNYTLIDDEDYEKVIMYNWTFDGRYAVIIIKKVKIYLHRFIMNTPENVEVDHIDGNKLNNQKINLRNCLSKENHKNKSKYSINKTGYKGVHWAKANKKWRASIQNNGKVIYLGYFDNILDAVRAYDLAAIKYHGKYANLNFDISNYQ